MLNMMTIGALLVVTVHAAPVVNYNTLSTDDTTVLTLSTDDTTVLVGAHNETAERSVHAEGWRSDWQGSRAAIYFSNQRAGVGETYGRNDWNEPGNGANCESVKLNTWYYRASNGYYGVRPRIDHPYRTLSEQECKDSATDANLLGRFHPYCPARIFRKIDNQYNPHGCFVHTGNDCRYHATLFYNTGGHTTPDDVKVLACKKK